MPNILSSNQLFLASTMSRYLLTIILILIGLSTQAQKKESSVVVFFIDDAPVKLTLVTDVIALQNDKSEEPEYIKGMLIYHIAKYEIESFDIKVKARGSTRRLSGLCDFPPLKLNFKKGDVKNTEFAGLDKVKFVSQCRQDELFKEYLLEEYLLYKTYNILTENSYHARLVEIEIKDIKLRTESIQMTGFIIEDDKNLEKRTSSKKYKEMVHNQDSCETESVDVLSMFQYMIGNTDWYINTNHNIDVFARKDGSLFPVAYDFDFAGVINTAYAKPSREIPIKRVTQRYFKGSCRASDAYNPVIELFNSRRAEIFQLYSSFEYLSKPVIKKSLRYYSKFYKILNNPSTAESSFYQACNVPVHIPAYIGR